MAVEPFDLSSSVRRYTFISSYGIHNWGKGVSFLQSELLSLQLRKRL